ncbi:uncharacterized protein LOC127750952 [Frankliniella occidentalis]|uniref:Uncharacterized protein LOC127750952 n=1 Tax=Frankliniella occidentalis TaxID=133901 RepID=A0A9C6X5R8_FRAOC|nr:uncharacterized protein LOC127750952 [Frankliniella occidentalis]
MTTVTTMILMIALLSCRVRERWYACQAASQRSESHLNMQTFPWILTPHFLHSGGVHPISISVYIYLFLFSSASQNQSCCQTCHWKSLKKLLPITLLMTTVRMMAMTMALNV